jgi:hypothetical protein
LWMMASCSLITMPCYEVDFFECCSSILCSFSCWDCLSMELRERVSWSCSWRFWVSRAGQVGQLYCSGIWGSSGMGA